MFAILFGMGFGCVVGVAAAGALGGSLGIVAGAIAGALFTDIVDRSKRVAAGTPLVREEQRILCVPRGQVAQATFVRDAAHGRWLDVERCSLCAPDREIQCEKRCLPLIRSALPPRKHPARTVEPDVA
ncbi:MAG TPA: hypothetical protein VF384_03120 [Planctomycetota bacterium]